MAFLLPCVSMGIALLLHLAQWVTSWISSAVARSRVGVEACPDLTDSFGVDPGAIEVVDRSPFGFVCQASTYDGGTTMIEHSGVTSAMFATSAGLAALSVAALLGVLLAFAVTRLIGATRSGRTDGAVGRGALLLVAVGVFVLPLMMLGQYLQWYSKSDGFGICPGSVGGNDVLGFSVTASYLPPSLTCSGDSVTGQEFSVVQHGSPFYGFVGGVIVAAVGLIVLIVERVRRPRVEADQQLLWTVRD